MLNVVFSSTVQIYASKIFWARAEQTFPCIVPMSFGGGGSESKLDSSHGFAWH